MKIVTGLLPSVRKWVLPAGSAHISLGGVALALPTSASGATLTDRVDLFVLEFATSADSAEAREGTAQSFTLLGTEPVIEKRGIEYTLFDGHDADIRDAHDAHQRAKHGAPADAIVTDRRDFPIDVVNRRVHWFEVTI